MNDKPKRLICAIDVETSGPDPMTCHLREIAIVPLTDDLERSTGLAVLEHQVRLYDNESQDREAYDLHGIHRDDGRRRDYVAREIALWAQGRRLELCGRNIAGFDCIVLRRLMGDAWYRQHVAYHVRDSAALQLAMQDAGLLPPGRFSLASLAEELGVSWQGRTHSALADALMEAKVYREMVRRISAPTRPQEQP